MRLGLGLRLSDVVAAVRGGAVVKSTLVDGLVAYWPLGETSGTRNDVVGTNHLTDNNTVGYDTGKNGNAAIYDPANGEFLSQAALDESVFSAAFTLSLWFKPTTEDRRGIMEVASSANSGGPHVLLQIDTGDGLRLYYGGGFQIAVTPVPAVNAWHHVSLAFNGTNTLTMVTDGNASTPVTITPTNAGILRLGSGYPTWHSGLIDEVALWSRVLTSDERAELYNSGSGKFYNATSEDFEE